MLNEDFKNISLHFVENNLVINLKADKIKCMLVGTSRNLSTDPNQLKLFYNHTQIYFAESIIYLYHYQLLTKN